MMATLTCSFSFSASHRLHLASLSEHENEELYGKCNYPFGHGHNYVLDVSVRGPVNEVTGQVVARATLNAFVQREVLDLLDHCYLNLDVQAFARTVPTTENLAAHVRDVLEAKWRDHFSGSDAVLSRIAIQETPRNRFEILLGEAQ